MQMVLREYERNRTSLTVWPAVLRHWRSCFPYLSSVKHNIQLYFLFSHKHKSFNFKSRRVPVDEFFYDLNVLDFSIN